MFGNYRLNTLEKAIFVVVIGTYQVAFISFLLLASLCLNQKSGQRWVIFPTGSKRDRKTQPVQQLTMLSLLPPRKTQPVQQLMMLFSHPESTQSFAHTLLGTENSRLPLSRSRLTTRLYFVDETFGDSEGFRPTDPQRHA